MRTVLFSALVVFMGLGITPVLAAPEKAPNQNQDARKPTLDEARDFLKRAEQDLAEFSEYAQHVYWVQANFITYDTNWLASRVGAEGTELAVSLANKAKRYQNLDMPQEMKRKFHALKAGITLPAPEARAGAAKKLAEISTWLESTYSTGKYTYKGKELNLEDMSRLMSSSRDPEELKELWTGWRTISPPMRERYAELVAIANEGAKELGFKNLGEMWRSNYDMAPQAFSTEVERLWTQVEPLYKQLHCYVRAELNEAYGDDVQPLDAPIRADLLGNMWAQEWGNIYDVIAPDTQAKSYDLTKLLEDKGYTPKKMVEAGEAFFSSLGFEPLPQTFWERSLITRPRDREVVCHASAWDINDKDDIRIKMCTQVTGDDFRTVHHELGHNYYQRAYKDQDPLFRTGAHDGFHEAIGDMVALSITPGYLVKIGLLDKAPDKAADLPLLMRQALNKVAFLPFGLLIDKWRWQVFSGDLKPEDYNKGWWALREKYQGIRPPAPRGANAFDPGAKYHIPGNTPYMRYFLAHILQFQFHKAACDMAGWKGSLNRCSVYQSKEAGERFKAMVTMGASKPWPEVLETFTGSKTMDAQPLLDYFHPLSVWLEEQNKGRQCGW